MAQQSVTSVRFLRLRLLESNAVMDTAASDCATLLTQGWDLRHVVPYGETWALFVFTKTELSGPVERHIPGTAYNFVEDWPGELARAQAEVEAENKADKATGNEPDFYSQISDAATKIGAVIQAETSAVYEALLAMSRKLYEEVITPELLDALDKVMQDYPEEIGQTGLIPALPEQRSAELTRRARYWLQAAFQSTRGLLVNELLERLGRVLTVKPGDPKPAGAVEEFGLQGIESSAGLDHLPTLLRSVYAPGSFPVPGTKMILKVGDKEYPATFGGFGQIVINPDDEGSKDLVYQEYSTQVDLASGPDQTRIVTTDAEGNVRAVSDPNEVYSPEFLKRHEEIIQAEADRERAWRGDEDDPPVDPADEQERAEAAERENLDNGDRQ